MCRNVQIDQYAHVIKAVTMASTQAYGNGALALLLCVGSNTIGIATIPFFLKAMLSSSTSVSLNAVDLLIKLVIGILVPLAIGKLLLNIPAVERFTKKHKTVLKLLNNGSLIMVLWQSISRAQVQPQTAMSLVLHLHSGSLQRWASLHSTAAVTCFDSTATASARNHSSQLCIPTAVGLLHAWTVHSHITH